MIEARRRVDIVLDPAFLHRIGDVGIDELRERRRLADEVETEFSYYRRMLHGRMDLLAFEQRRRRGEETRSLIEALPEILGAGETVGRGGGRMTLPLAPHLPEVRRRTIDRVLESDFLARLSEVSDSELEEYLEALAEVEGEISEQRRAVQRVFDTFQAEIAARYKTGLIEPTAT